MVHEESTYFWRKNVTLPDIPDGIDHADGQLQLLQLYLHRPLSLTCRWHLAIGWVIVGRFVVLKYLVEGLSHSEYHEGYVNWAKWNENLSLGSISKRQHAITRCLCCLLHLGVYLGLGFAIAHSFNLKINDDLTIDSAVAFTQAEFERLICCLLKLDIGFSVFAKQSVTLPDPQTFCAFRKYRVFPVIKNENWSLSFSHRLKNLITIIVAGFLATLCQEEFFLVSEVLSTRFWLPRTKLLLPVDCGGIGYRRILDKYPEDRILVFSGSSMTKTVTCFVMLILNVNKLIMELNEIQTMFPFQACWCCCRMFSSLPSCLEFRYHHLQVWLPSHFLI